MEQIPKITFSRSMAGGDWKNAHLRREATEILEDKNGEGKGLLIFGSLGLVHSFLELDAIDEFWMFQSPILLGASIPYFQGAAKTKLELASHKPFDNGVIRLHLSLREWLLSSVGDANFTITRHWKHAAPRVF